MSAERELGGWGGVDQVTNENLGAERWVADGRVKGRGGESRRGARNEGNRVWVGDREEMASGISPIWVMRAWHKQVEVGDRAMRGSCGDAGKRIREARMNSLGSR